MEFQANRVFRTFIEGSLKHSQVGHLEHEAWLGSLEARHTVSFLRAVPESNVSETAKCTIHRYFLDQIFVCLNTPNIQSTQESCISLRRAHESKDDGTQGIKSASREKYQLHLSLGNVTLNIESKALQN